MTKIKKNIDKALKKVEEEIHLNATSGGIYSGPVSGEGYSGGYRDALMDIKNLLNGVLPRRRDYWNECE